jgi:hypothetical protein
MSAASNALSLQPTKDYRGILWGGLLAGILDITAAIVSTAVRSGRGPLVVLQSVASGILGANSYKGGIPAAALGLVIHFFNAYVICTIFFLASQKLPFLSRQWILCGVLYGIGVYFVMYGIVLRLTFHRNFLTPFSSVLLNVLIHIFCVGLPIAFAVQRFSKGRPAE